MAAKERRANGDKIPRCPSRRQTPDARPHALRLAPQSRLNFNMSKNTPAPMRRSPARSGIDAPPEGASTRGRLPRPPINHQLLTINYFQYIYLPENGNNYFQLFFTAWRMPCGAGFPCRAIVQRRRTAAGSHLPPPALARAIIPLHPPSRRSNPPLPRPADGPGGCQGCSLAGTSSGRDE